METERLDVHLESSLRHKLAALAKETDRNEDELIGEAVENFLELQLWQRERIAQAIAEADRGEFAAPEDVDRVFDKYRPHP